MVSKDKRAMRPQVISHSAHSPKVARFGLESVPLVASFCESLDVLYDNCSTCSFLFSAPITGLPWVQVLRMVAFYCGRLGRLVKQFVWDGMAGSYTCILVVTSGV